MTAEPDLPINDAVPAPTKIEPGNLFLWNWRQMQVYAQACVAHATAAQAAEIEALRAQLDEQCRLHAIGMERELALIAERDRLRVEVERLRAIAGCAYQMAGVHDAPEVWLDRLGQAANGDALPDPDTISDELLPYQPDAVCEAEARAERLAEALRELRNHTSVNSDQIALIDAALEQENDDA